eukprot:4471082-Prymnesium_polylepis.1
MWACGCGCGHVDVDVGGVEGQGGGIPCGWGHQGETPCVPCVARQGLCGAPARRGRRMPY